MTDAYREDLAYIHDEGHGDLANAAAAFLVGALRRAGLAAGLVIDLGCGSGILSEQVLAAGYDVLGIDVSPAMLALARQRAPGGRFVEASLLTAELPPCVAVAAVGEAVNYLFDSGNSRAALTSLFRRAHAALCPGGLLLCDAAGPGRVPGGGPSRLWSAGADWAVLVTVTEDRRRRLLTRDITSFRQVGELYRRDHEVHRQRLLVPAELTAQMHTAGFRVRLLRGYGALRFKPGLAGFLARKGPSRRASLASSSRVR
jgi:SAM-dependent methyltransferase